ncbi:MAG: acyltransferase [Rickettsiales bacterium]|nr:acyltransferase [Rickettsiales bacterium]
MADLSTTFNDSKKHYMILDGLRGIAAIMVVMFHILETFAIGDPYKQLVNHGYLAVDFFFMLSGFVIAYAYDDRWGKMTMRDFFRRRLIRLHPMIIMGMLFGAVLFYFQDSPMFLPIGDTPVSQMLLVTLIGFTLIPLPPSMDIRGWQEMHPLNGPAWSLFFEYVANIFYALFLRRISKMLLIVLIVLSGGALVHMIMNSGGDVIGGWSLTPKQLWVGSVRLLYPFLTGILISRVITPGSIKNAFWWCALLIIAALAMPRFGTPETEWINGVYEASIILLVFPIIIYIGASGSVSGQLSRLNKFLGDISYPIYITHYTLVYTYMAWVTRNSIEINSTQNILMAIGLFIISIVAAYIVARWYDAPVRKWLTRKFIGH